jgi:hypothetical protein
MRSLTDDDEIRVIAPIFARGAARPETNGTETPTRSSCLRMNGKISGVGDQYGIGRAARD